MNKIQRTITMLIVAAVLVFGGTIASATDNKVREMGQTNGTGLFDAMIEFFETLF